MNHDELRELAASYALDALSDEERRTFETHVDATFTLADRAGGQRELTDDEFERAFAEIQSTIQNYRK